METAYQQELTHATVKRLAARSQKYEAWIVHCDGDPIPMDPTPTKAGAHARAKAHFFYHMQQGKMEAPFSYSKWFPDMDPHQMKKEFKEWYKNHCKAVQIL